MPSSSTQQKPDDGWRPIEVPVERNGYDPAPIEVPVTTADIGGTAPAPTSKAASPAKDKEH